MTKASKLYEGRDPREIAAYSIAEVSAYVGIPPSTLHAWVRGQAGFKPVIRLEAYDGPIRFSFFNLVEAHVLAALRREYKLPLQTIRRGIAYVNRTIEGPHPLATKRFATDRRGLFLLDQSGTNLVTVTRGGQTAFHEVLAPYLRRIDHDSSGLAARFYPFTRSTGPSQPKVLVMDPRIRFGQPVLRGTGVPVSVVVDRYKAGDSIADLAEDFSCSRDLIEEAIRCAVPAA